MTEFIYTITDKDGIHARPAGLLAKTAQGYQSTFELICEGMEADAKRVMSIMMLGAKQGDTIVVRIEGEDCDSALVAIKHFFTSYL